MQHRPLLRHVLARRHPRRGFRVGWLPAEEVKHHQGRSLYAKLLIVECLGPHPDPRTSEEVLSLQDGQRTRTERDSMGEMQVPGHALYGASTQRAVLNFPVSHLRFNRRFIRALAQIKLAAAEVNRDLGLLDQKHAEPIIAAAREVVDGKWDDEFVIDIFQTGSGTSTNMNANEVIANLAIERMGGERGARGLVHPNDHVNIGQSSNDVIPSAIQLAALTGLEEDLIPACEE